MSCPSCDPTLAPTSPRKSEGHVALRFHDYLFHVFQHGAEIRDCYEVECPDRAWRYALPVVVCDCGNGAAAYIDESGGFAAGRRLG